MTNGYKTDRIVLITAPLPAGGLERLQRQWPELRFELRSPREKETISDELWRNVEVLYMWFATYLPKPEQAPHLRWVQLYSAGADYLAHRSLYQTQVTFTTTSGIHAIPIAEYVMTMILSWFRRLPTLLKLQAQQHWPPGAERWTQLMPEEVHQKTIGIVGYGSIGRQVARLAQAFDMRVLAMQRGSDHRDRGYQIANVGDPDGILPERYFSPAALHEMLAACDVVVSAVPLTSSTREMFDAAAFRAMKSSAFLVNIARGGVCNEGDLIAALEERQIAGAALDVFEQEPLPAGSPLWRLPNVLISPHVSGLTTHYDERALALFSENLRRYLSSEPLFNVVDKTLGY